VSESTAPGDCSLDAEGHPQVSITVYDGGAKAAVTVRVFAAVTIGHSAKKFRASNVLTVPARSITGPLHSGTTTLTFSGVTTEGTVHCSMGSVAPA
jgi:hypothetical protein